MSFGGYKFAGFRASYDSNQTYTERALVIHKTRLNAFVTASAAVGSPWVLDPDRLDGSVAFGTTTGAIHAMKDSNDDVCGYASFLKYIGGTKTGYYLIMTVRKYAIDYASGINFTGDQTMNVYQTGRGPYYASCLHALSLSPFGDLPVDGGQSVDLIPSDSTRIMSVGGNGFYNSSPLASSDCGFVGYQGDCVFGYAIRGTDIISFARTGTKYNAADNNNFVQTLSVDAFAEYYNVEDNKGLLAFCPLGDGVSSNNKYEYGGNGNYIGKAGQLLSPNAAPMSMRGNRNLIKIFPDVRSCFESSGANIIPLSGVVLAVDGQDVFDSGQYAKGCTNPEFFACNFSNAQLSNTLFDQYANSLLYVNSIAGNTGNYGLRTVSPTSATLGSASYSGLGYFNMYVGWDEDNPDIRTEAAWPVYNG